MLYECVTQECPEMLPTYIAIEQVTHTGCIVYLRCGIGSFHCQCFSILAITFPGKKNNENMLKKKQKTKAIKDIHTDKSQPRVALKCKNWFSETDNLL